MKKFYLKNRKFIWLILPVFLAAAFYYPVIGLVAIVCMIMPALTAYLKGRKYCGFYCPRGAMNDVLLSKISLRIHSPALLSNRYVKIVFFALLMAFFAVQISLAENIGEIGMVFVRMIFITTLLAIAMGIFITPRAWCMICPMGSLASFTALKRKHDIKNLKIDAARCVSCGACEKNCPMHIKILSHLDSGQISDSSCIKCGKCVSVCPRKAIYL